MTLLEYKEKTNLDVKTQPEKAKYICYYQMKENCLSSFSIGDIKQWFIEFGYSEINPSRLKDWSDTIKVQCLNCRKTKEYCNEKVRSKFQGRGIKALRRHWNQEGLRTA